VQCSAANVAPGVGGSEHLLGPLLPYRPTIRARHTQRGPRDALGGPCSRQLVRQEAVEQRMARTFSRVEALRDGHPRIAGFTASATARLLSEESDAPCAREGQLVKQRSLLSELLTTCAHEDEADEGEREGALGAHSGCDSGSDGEEEQANGLSMPARRSAPMAIQIRGCVRPGSAPWRAHSGGATWRDRSCPAWPTSASKAGLRTAPLPCLRCGSRRARHRKR
jgi:hypothetical protein